LYIAHYKSVNSATEFYSKARETLDYPTQIEHEKERYTLNSTYIMNGQTQLKNFKERIKSLGIQIDVNVDDK
jgi:hypothetical protein